MGFLNHDAFGRGKPSYCRGNWRMQPERFVDKAIEMIQALNFLVRYISRANMECDFLAQLRRLARIQREVVEDMRQSC